MKYNCIDCNYLTDDRCNWARHNKSQSHLNKVDDVVNSKKQQADDKCAGTCAGTCADKCAGTCAGTFISEKQKFVCLHCEVSFSSNSCLSRHKKHRCTKNQFDETNDKLKNKDDLIKELKKDKEYFKSLAEKAGNVTSSAITIAKKSMSALNYITKNFTNAPPLKPMEDYSAIEYYCGDYGVAFGVITLHKDGDLIKNLGNMLIDHYKKSDPNQQSFWNSDNSRLSYVIRTLIRNKPSWVIDKKGVQLKDYIKPLLSHLDKEVCDYLNNLNKTNQATKNTDILGLAANFLENIRNSVICDNLIRYIAPHFQLSSARQIMEKIEAEPESKPKLIMPKLEVEPESKPKLIIPKLEVEPESKPKLIIPKLEIDSEYEPPKRSIKGKKNIADSDSEYEPPKRSIKGKKNYC
jgi:hypothetical protein